MTELFIHLLVAHLTADWIFQNQWMAVNKTNIRHPALYVHGFIHFVWMVLLSGLWLPVIVVAVIHMLIDTRIPVQWWMKVYGQTTEGEYAIHVQIWLDQVFHVVSIYLAVLLLTGG